MLSQVRAVKHMTTHLMTSYVLHWFSFVDSAQLCRAILRPRMGASGVWSETLRYREDFAVQLRSIRANSMPDAAFATWILRRLELRAAGPDALSLSCE